MQRAQLCAGLGLGIMLATTSASAGQVDLSVEGRLGGESNVFRSELNRVKDGTFEITPRLGVQDRNDDLSYSLYYMPTHRTFIETSGIDGFDHRARGTGNWALTDIDQIEATASYYNGRQFRSEDTAAGPAQSFEFNDRERVGIAELKLGYQRLLSPRTSLGFGFDFEDFDASGTSQNSQTDSRAYTGRVSLRHSLNEITQVGISASGRRRENRAVDPFVPISDPSDIRFPGFVEPRTSTETDVWDLLFSVSRSLSPTIDVSVQAGPSFIRQQQIPSDSPLVPPTIGKDESRDVTVFAAASAEKRWQSTNVGLSYVRSEARSGSTSSSSSISDVVELSTRHQFNDALTVRWLVAYNRFDQISSQEGGDERFELTSIRSTASFEYVINRRLSLVGQYTFLWQVVDRSALVIPSRVNVHLGSLGLRYTFEPLSY